MSLYSLLTNNIFVNNFLIMTGLDAKKELSLGQWKAFRYNHKRSVQQNAGFSHNPEVEESLARVKEKLVDFLNANVRPGGKLLDIGCGPGIYMKMLSERYRVTGVDVSGSMLSEAQALLPLSNFFHGNFLDMVIREKFDAVYSVSVLEYVPVSRLNDFFMKCAEVLNGQGVLFIQYPHALRRIDLYYPDRNYISYSPELITRVASKYLKVIENRHSYDHREACKFDASFYPTQSKTFKNGYLLLASRK